MSLVPEYATTILNISPAPGDYTAITNMQLTFSATVQSQTVTVAIGDDDVVERLETFNITLTTSDPSVVLIPMTATVDIQDDDSELYIYRVGMDLGGILSFFISLLHFTILPLFSGNDWIRSSNLFCT